MATKVKLIADGAITPDQITLTTASAGTNTTAPATTAFVQQEITALVDSSPAALNTLNELAAALGDDANFSTTVTNSIATKAPLASPDFTGDATFDTSTLIVDATNDRVGIGIAPLTTFHVNVSANKNFVLQDALSSTAVKFLNDGGTAYTAGTINASTLSINGDSGGNVGIGTSSPDADLSLLSPVYSSGGAGNGIRFQNQNNNADAIIQSYYSGTSSSALFFAANAYVSTSPLFTSFDNTKASSFLLANTNGSVEFGNAASGNPTTKMLLNSSGNVGIGTISPNQDGFGSSSRVLTVKAPSSGGTGALELIGLANSSGDLMSAINFMSYAVTSPAARITALRHTSDTEASISFDTSGAERMRITPTQTEVSFLRANSWQNGSLSTVGGPALEIGTAGSSGYVHGYNRNTSSYIPVSYDGSEHRWYKSGTGPYATLNTSGQFLINFSNPASTSNFLLGVDGSIGLGGDDFIAAGAGYGPSNSSSGAGTIKLYDTGTGNMQFNQTYSHARYYFYHGGNEVFRIEDGGFSGIYGYSFYYTTQYGSVGLGALNNGYHHTMAASGPSTFYWNNRCEASGGFHTYSDERFKENITTIPGALDKVALMNGVTFNWIDAENRGSGDTGKQFGVIAQNMLTVDPELPSLNPDPLATQEEIDNEELETDYYTMDYSRITPFLIEAIKELKTKLEAAEARITELEG